MLNSTEELTRLRRWDTLACVQQAGKPILLLR
jgi:hypothetical protein